MNLVLAFSRLDAQILDPEARDLPDVEGVVRWTTEQMDETCPLGFGIRLVRVDEEYLRFFEKILLG